MRFTKIILCFVAISIIAGGCKSTGNQENKKQQKASNYQDACKNLDFETAREYMSELHQIYIDAHSKNMGVISRENRDSMLKVEKKYYEAFDYIYQAEIQYLLSEYNEDECADKISFLMAGIPIEGEKAPAGLCNYFVASRDFSNEGISLDVYIIWIKHYNRLCNTILTLSINRNYPKLAKVALMQFVDNVEAHEGGDGVKIDGVKVDGNHGYIKYTSTDRDAAKKKYNEAVKMGYLK